MKKGKKKQKQQNRKRNTRKIQVINHIMTKIKELFTQDVIDYYKNNQNEITEELLSKIRSYGNEGKELALEILDTKK